MASLQEGVYYCLYSIVGYGVTFKTATYCLNSFDSSPTSWYCHDCKQLCGLHYSILPGGNFDQQAADTSPQITLP